MMAFAMRAKSQVAGWRSCSSAKFILQCSSRFFWRKTTMDRKLPGIC